MAGPFDKYTDLFTSGAKAPELGPDDFGWVPKVAAPVVAAPPPVKAPKREANLFPAFTDGPGTPRWTREEYVAGEMAQPESWFDPTAKTRAMEKAVAGKVGEPAYPGGPLLARPRVSATDTPAVVNDNDVRYTATKREKIPAADTSTGKSSQSMLETLGFGNDAALADLERQEAAEKEAFVKPNEYGVLSSPSAGEKLGSAMIGIPAGMINATAAQVFKDKDGNPVELFPRGDFGGMGIGESLAHAPGALFDKVTDETKVVLRDGVGEGLSNALNLDEMGNWWTGNSKAENPYNPHGALVEGASKLGDELAALVTVPAHIGGEIMKLDDRSGKAGDARTRMRGLVDSAGDVAAAVGESFVNQIMDPPQGVERGLIQTAANVIPISGLAAKAVKRVPGLNPNLTSQRAAVIGLTDQIAPAALEAEKLLGASRGAQEAAVKAGTAVENATIAKRPNLPDLRLEQIKADAKAVKAADDLAQFDQNARLALDDALKQRRRVEAELSSGRNKEILGIAISRIPAALLTGGATAVADGVKILAARALPRSGGLRYMLNSPDQLAMEYQAIKREVGNGARHADIIRQELVRKIPKEHRPTVQMMLEAEAMQAEGGWFAPGNDYAQHVVRYKDGRFFVTEFGEAQKAKWHAETGSADAAVASEANRLLQKLDGDLYLANKYGVPIAERTAKLTQEAIELGLLDEFNMPAWLGARNAERAGAVSARDAAVKAAEKEYQGAAQDAGRTQARATGSIEIMARRILEGLQKSKGAIDRAADGQQIRSGARSVRLADSARQKAVARYAKDFTDGTNPTNRPGKWTNTATSAERQGAARWATGEGPGRVARDADIAGATARETSDLAHGWQARERARGVSDRELGPQGASAERVGKVAQDRNAVTTGYLVRELERRGVKRDKAVAAADAAMAESLAKVDRQVPPNGLRDVYLPQVYDAAKRRQRLNTRRDLEEMQASDGKGPLKMDPYLDASRLKQNKLRAGQVPVTRRADDYGYKRDLESSVLVGLGALEYDIGAFKQFRAMARDPAMSITKEAFEAKRADWLARERGDAISRGQRPKFDEIEDLKRRTPIDDEWEFVHDTPRFTQKGPNGETIKGPSMYGELSGRYVKADPWFDMVNGRQMAEQMGEWLPRMQAYWKGFKTIQSPSTHSRNWLTNILMLAPMAGVSLLNPRNLPLYKRVLEAIAAGEKSPLWREMYEAGVFGGGFQKSELARAQLASDLAGAFENVKDPFKAFMRMSMRGGEAATAGVKETLSGAGRKEARVKARLREMEPDGAAWAKERAANPKPQAGALAGEAVAELGAGLKGVLWDLPGLLYGVGDDLFRGVKWLKETSRGVPSAEAVTMARRAFVDYENVPGLVNVMRSPFAATLKKGTAAEAAAPSKWTKAVWWLGGKPFLAYPSRAIPVMARWVKANPFQANANILLHDYLTDLNLGIAGLDPDDVKSQIGMMSAFQRLTTSAVGAYYPPWTFEGDPKDRKLNFLSTGFLDPSSGMKPEADALAGDGEVGINALFDVTLGGNPILGPLMEQGANYDSFRKRKIVRDGSSAWENIMQRGSHLIGAFGSPIMPSLTDIAGGEMGAGGTANPNRLRGGALYEKLAAAMRGEADYAGRMRTVTGALLEAFGLKGFHASAGDTIRGQIPKLKDRIDSGRGLTRDTTGIMVNKNDQSTEEADIFSRDFRQRIAGPLEKLAEGVAKMDPEDPDIARINAELEYVLRQESDEDYVEAAEDFVREWLTEIGDERAEQRRDATDINLNARIEDNAE